MTTPETVIFWILLPIVIIILFIMLIACCRIAITQDYPCITEDLDLSRFKTGDIVGVGYTHPFGWFVKAWSASIWSHTGIIWENPKDGQLYVLEAAIYYGKYKGLFKIPLIEWIRINRKSYIGISRLKGKIDGDKLIACFKERKKHVKLEAYNWRWYRLLYTKPYTGIMRKKYTCYEIVIDTLQDVGVVEKKHCSSSYFPYHIMYGKLDMCKGYELEPVVMLDTTNITMLRHAEEDCAKRKKKGMAACCNTCFGSWMVD